MPLRATVTPLSLYMLDNTVFDGLQLPTPPENPTDYPDLYVSGFTLDRQTLIDSILMECGELDCIYPDPNFFKYAVTSWSTKELHVWQALYDTLFYKYNPLWNKDGTIKETARDLTQRETSGARSKTGSNSQTITDTIDETDTHQLTDQRTLNLSTVTDDTTTNTGTVQNAGTDTTNGTTGATTQVSAYNETGYRNREKTDGTNADTTTSSSTRTDNLSEDYDSTLTETGTDTTAHTGTLQHDGDNTREISGSDSEREENDGQESGSLDHSLTRTEQGNIGVTMTTQLIEAQRALVQLNFYDLIVDKFKERFCLLVY